MKKNSGRAKTTTEGEKGDKRGKRGDLAEVKGRVGSISCAE